MDFNHEQLIRIQTMENEVNSLKTQLDFIENNILELNALNESLDALEKNKDILVNIGKRVFLPVSITEKKLIVDVGSSNLVKKNIVETKKIIEDQIASLMKAKGNIMKNLEDLQEEMEELINQQTI
ncbi:prefoldin subunit alpha [Candidatus Pacearchaeota archaeon]|nr:prefoldin subunit alpha [Candidatus Pacearchaeota archaeon]